MNSWAGPGYRPEVLLCKQFRFEANSGVYHVTKVVSLHGDRPKTARDRPRPPPKHLGLPEKQLWRRLTAAYRFDEVALLVLEEALKSLRTSRQCRERIEADGVVIEGPSGEPQAHPLMYAERMSQQAFVFAMKQLKLGFVAS